MHPVENIPGARVGNSVAVYVWQYPLRLTHWILLISIAVLGFTGYYLHNPFIPGRSTTPFLMGWFRFVHEAVGMVFIAFCMLRFYLFFGGNHWESWRQIVPRRAKQFREATEVMKFYAFLRPTPVAKVGHNAMAAFSYIGIYSMVFVEIVTGLVMYNWLAHSPILTPLLAWIPRFISIQNIRLIHFCLMFVFIAFGILHVHLCLIVSAAEKRGLMDSIFTGYKIIPVNELEEDDRNAIAASTGKNIKR